MDTLDALAELAEAEYRVPEINAQIDAQRRLIEALAFEGYDITSAQLVLDSLLMSLFFVHRGTPAASLNSKYQGGGSPCRMMDVPALLAKGSKGSMERGT